MAFELRWTVPDRTTTEAPRLQFRQLDMQRLGWSDWLDVPVVVMPRTLCTCRDGFGRPRCPVHEGAAGVNPSTKTKEKPHG